MKRKRGRIVGGETSLRVLILATVLALPFLLDGWADSPLSSVRQLTFDGRRSGEGYFSPDGNRLIFQSERDQDNPFYQIFVLDLTTGDSRRISPGVGKTTCGFFRPGTGRVLYSSTHHDPQAKAKQQAELDFRASGQIRRYSWDYDETMDVFSADSDGSNLRQLTSTLGYDAEGSYSPDGKLVVFCSLRSAFPLKELSEEDRQRYQLDPSYFGELYLMKADGSQLRRLTNHPGYDGGPFFTPDGEHIVWRRFDKSGATADIFTVRIDGTGLRQLTDFQSMSWAPYCHPSGQYVIFTSNKFGFGNFELFLVDRNGLREPVRVTHTDGFDGLPVFSPQGDTLSWTSDRNDQKQSQLYLGAWDHEAALQVLQFAPLRPRANTGLAASPTPEAGSVPAIERLSRDIEETDHRIHVGYLASEELAGRRTGSEGSRAAAQFAVEVFRHAGLSEIGLPPGHAHSFEFTQTIQTAEEGNLLSAANDTFQVEEDFRPLSFSADGETQGKLVFAGYGLAVPGALGEGYDSYAGLNVSNKIVLALRYVPEDVAPERRETLNRYAGLRYKAMTARDRGARGILIVAGPNSPGAGTLITHRFDSSLAGSDILAASISGRTAERLLQSADQSLKELQTSLDRENPHALGGFELPDVEITLGTRIERVKGTDDNILGWLPPGTASAAPEFVIVGAHYDHLGLGGSHSLHPTGEEQAIHYGADDNASGVSTVLELAVSLAARREQQPDTFRRGVLFALWSGEEIGLIGSSKFAERFAASLGQAVVYLNFDMVGRLRDNRLILQGVGSSAVWPRVIERKNVVSGFDLKLQSDPYLPTDSTVFYNRGVPILSFFTGSHEDYHRPSDTADKINYRGLTRISRFAESLVLDLVSRPEAPGYVKVDQTPSRGGNRDSMRAFLGTIPDYAAELQGVKLSGVSGGGPADRAGLKAEDVIVRLAGRKISNIYEYTYAIDSLKIGEPSPVVVRRGEQTLELEIVPELRR